MKLLMRARDGRPFGGEQDSVRAPLHTELQQEACSRLTAHDEADDLQRVRGAAGTGSNNAGQPFGEDAARAMRAVSSGTGSGWWGWRDMAMFLRRDAISLGPDHAMSNSPPVSNMREFPLRDTHACYVDGRQVGSRTASSLGPALTCRS